jgi:hypothetical protein
MSYAINYQKHILDYLRQHVTGTSKEIVEALPKGKRRATASSMITQALILLCSKGEVVRVAQGVYAQVHAKVSLAHILSDRDECSARIITLLESRRNQWTATDQIVCELSKSSNQVCYKTNVKHRLKRMEAHGIVHKDNKLDAWHIRAEAVEGRAAAVPLRKSKTPRANGIAGESVPAYNILRKRGTHRDPATIAIPIPQTQPAAEPEQFTIPPPSIFD